MRTEAGPNSGRRTGRTAGLCLEGTTMHRFDFPVARAHAYRIREETCAAWSLGWAWTGRKRGPRLRRKPQSAVRRPAEGEGGTERLPHFPGPQISSGKNQMIKSQILGASFYKPISNPLVSVVSRKSLVIQLESWAGSPRWE